jgi:hypothetical protein
MDRITELLSNLQSITPEDPRPALRDGPGFRQDHDDACCPRRWRAVGRRHLSDPLTHQYSGVEPRAPGNSQVVQDERGVWQSSQKRPGDHWRTRVEGSETAEESVSTREAVLAPGGAL